MMRITSGFLALSLLCIAGPALGGEDGLQLALPLKCTLGSDCFIQQYTDIDPGPQATDYRCGSATHDGLKGTGFRLKSVVHAARGVQVIAAAPGRVKAIRDGMDDRLISTTADTASVKDSECGNGVVIEHGAGWETQYCHMRRGSVRVKIGQAVETGTQLGLVGYSGLADFAHLHLSVRRNGTVVDPFLGINPGATCQAENIALASSLWAPKLRGKLTYTDAIIIDANFTSGAVSPKDVESKAIAAPGPRSPNLVFYVRLINLRKNDSLRLTATGPGGFEAASNVAPLDNNKAQFVAFAGTKLAGNGGRPAAIGGRSRCCAVAGSSSGARSRSICLDARALPVSRPSRGVRSPRRSSASPPRRHPTRSA